MSMFGRQPAADILKERGIRRGDAAKVLGVKHSVLNNTLAGRQTPSDVIRDGLPKMLDMPLEKLFNPEPLARKQGKRYRQGAVLTRGDDPTIRHRRRRTAKKITAENELKEDENGNGNGHEKLENTGTFPGA